MMAAAWSEEEQLAEAWAILEQLREQSLRLTIASESAIMRLKREAHADNEGEQ